MKRDDIDFHVVADHHLEIHQRLTDWASWVRVRPHGWQTAPMFRHYRSHAWQWEAPIVRVQPNIPKAIDMERAVSLLPAKHRDAIRWCYVWQSGPVAEARRLGVSKQGLCDLIGAGRSMLVNRGA